MKAARDGRLLAHGHKGKPATLARRSAAPRRGWTARRSCGPPPQQGPELQRRERLIEPVGTAGAGAGLVQVGQECELRFSRATAWR